MNAVQLLNGHGLARIIDACRGASTVVFVPNLGCIVFKTGFQRVNAKLLSSPFIKRANSYQVNSN